jgi:hypothetical protein
MTMVTIVLFLARVLNEDWQRTAILVTYHVAVLIWWSNMGVFDR